MKNSALYSLGIGTFIMIIVFSLVILGIIGVFIITMDTDKKKERLKKNSSIAWGVFAL